MIRGIIYIPSICSFLSIIFQVDPRKHRLLFEVFDENRLVSFF